MKRLSVIRAGESYSAKWDCLEADKGLNGRASRPTPGAAPVITLGRHFKSKATCADLLRRPKCRTKAAFSHAWKYKLHSKHMPSDSRENKTMTRCNKTLSVAIRRLLGNIPKRLERKLDEGRNLQGK